MNNIEKCFDILIDCIEKQEYSNLNSFLDDNIVFKNSAIGNFEGKENVIQGLNESVIANIDSIKIRIFNNVIRNKDTNSIQSCYLIFNFKKTLNGFAHIFQCGFLTNIIYLNDKITSLVSNMTFEYGNSVLVADKWNLIDYRLINGNNNNLTESMRSPWNIDECSLSERIKIEQSFYHYCWLLDTANFNELNKVYNDSYFMINEKIQEYRNGKYISTNEAIKLFENTRYKEEVFDGVKIPKEACWNHIAHIEDVHIDGNSATAKIYRYEPNRIGTKFINIYTCKSIYYSGIWNIGFEKNDNKQWKISSFEFNNVITEDKNEIDQRYF